ncbi:hypothetical protein [Burkholderia ubonensis]|uniref:Uncharacterized protein n=1 Tax=Burkholderia ubonensis TaxID=101571 RepID=A0ABD4DZX0_9BURK|nr:hypothetical protein [Burkholderia ubonensis]KVN83514.1 hypothetical protein WJ68_16520 [Burkholderia ubonensis]
MDAVDGVFTVIGEGAALLAALDENSEGFFDDLNRLREILAQIGGGAAPSDAAVAAKLAFSLADKDASARELETYLQTGLAALPPVLAVFESQTVASLAAISGNEALAMDAMNWAQSNTPDVQPTAPETKIAAFEYFQQRGLSGSFSVDTDGFNRETLGDAVREGDKILSQGIAENADYLAVRAEIERERDARQARLTELIAIARGKTGASAAEMAAAISEYHTLQRDDFAIRLSQRNVDAWNKALADRTERHAQLFRDQGNAIRQKLLDASPVTAETANAWARAQIIDDNAKAKLKRLKYPVDDVTRDMAEFYRLTGGKSSTVRIGSGGRRANATGISTGTGEKVINLGTDFNKTVLWHELAHHLENDPIAKAASNGFLLKRRESERPYTLRSLTGVKGYRPDEVAYKDGFTDPYVGKVYRDGITEVWSMGLQYLAEPGSAAWFAGKDPEMFDLVTGYLHNPLTPAMNAKLNMHAGVIETAIDAAKEREAKYEAAIAWLAERAPITKDNWFETVDTSTYWFSMLEAYALGKEKTRTPVYIGSSGDFKVFSGVFTKLGTRRYAKGNMIVWGQEAQDQNVPENIAVHGGLETVSAVIAVAKINGTGPSTAYYRYFWPRDSETRIIDLVDGMK